MVKIERKKDTYLYWPYAIMLFLLPVGFYLSSKREEIEPLPHLLLITIIIWLALVGVFGITRQEQPLQVYGWLYLTASVVFAYMALVLIW